MSNPLRLDSEYAIRRTAVRAKGGRIWDEQGAEFVDLTMGAGSPLLGYACERVDRAVTAQLESGIVGTPLPALEAEVAELLRVVVPNAETVRFFRTGPEAGSAAIRAARAHTGRQKVLAFPCDDGDLIDLVAAIDADTACVIVEPCAFEEPNAELLPDLARVCRERGALLVFDESWSGFRLAHGGAQERFGVIPDLATFSNAVANGMPLAVLSGRAEAMKVFARQGLLFSSSGGDALALAAAAACLRALGECDVSAALAERGERLKEGFNQLAAELEAPYARCVGWPFRSLIEFASENDQDPLWMKRLLQQELAAHGVLAAGYQTLCYAHGDAEVEQVVRAYQAALPVVAEAVRAGRVEEMASEGAARARDAATSRTSASKSRSTSTRGRVRKRILFIGGDVLQTRQLHRVAQTLPEYEQFFTPYYGDLFLHIVRDLGWVEGAVVGRKRTQKCIEFLQRHGYAIDMYGENHGPYDLVVTCSDVVVPKNIRGRKIVVVQEGIMDPEHRSYKLIQVLPFLPKWLAGTAFTGQSGAYQMICVGSEGWKRHLLARGVPADRIRITGIPEFDDCQRFLTNSFPHREFVLLCTSDTRETWKKDDRKALCEQVKRIAAGRQIIIKPHPNERMERSLAEFRKYAPEAMLVTSGCAEEMVANCSVLIAQWSTLALVGLLLGKEVHSSFDVERLRGLLPLQNGGTSHLRIGETCREVLEGTRVSSRASVGGSAAPATSTSTSTSTTKGKKKKKKRDRSAA